MKNLACCAVVLSAACASNDKIDVTDEEYDDVAVSLASTMSPHGGGGELGAMSDVVLIARTGTLAGFVSDDRGHLHGEHVGLTYNYALTCRDANNRVLATCSETTDNADVVVEWSGVLDLPFMAMVIERDGEWMLNDVGETVSRLDGIGHMTYESRVESPDSGVTTTYELAYTADHRGILLGRDETWPRGGITLYSLTAERTRMTENTSDTRDFELDAELRFIAGGRATLTLDDRIYDVNLASGSVVRQPVP